MSIWPGTDPINLRTVKRERRCGAKPSPPSDKRAGKERRRTLDKDVGAKGPAAEERGASWGLLTLSVYFSVDCLTLKLRPVTIGV